MSDYPPYGWDAARQRYVELSTGLDVSIPRDAVMSAMQDRLTAAFDTMKAYGDALTNGGTDVSEWQNAMMVELRNAHTQMAALGSGGWDSVSQATWGEVGSRLKAEYQYLAGFAQDIADGKISLAEFDRRLDMYANDAWGSYWDAAGNSAEDAGMTEERAILSAGGKHCDGCMARADLGWQPIGTLDDIGAEECGSSDQCEFEYQ